MTVTQLLFGFKGRLKRLPWWIATILADLGLGIVDAIFGTPRPSVTGAIATASARFSDANRCRRADNPTIGMSNTAMADKFSTPS
jgi:hypothetical protein